MINRPNRKHERNLRIVEKLRTNDIDVVKAEYELTSQRIQMIYEQITGEPYSELVKEKREARLKIKELHLNTIKYKCAGCDKDVTHKEVGRKKKYCSECLELRTKKDRDPKITLICDNCGESFHPFRNYKYANAAHHFCKKECYFEHRIKHRKSPIVI